MSNGTRALLVVLASSAVGTGYYSYLTAVPFPPRDSEARSARVACCVRRGLGVVDPGTPRGRWKTALGRGSRAQHAEYDIRSNLPARGDDGRLRRSPLTRSRNASSSSRTSSSS